MQDTRQDPHNRPDLSDSPVDPAEDTISYQDSVDNLKDLVEQRATLENYQELVKAAGRDGLDPVAKQLMLLNLQQIKLTRNGVGMESFDVNKDSVSVEDFSEWLGNLAEKIKALIAKLIQMAKEYASKIMTGITKVKGQAEELMERAKKRARPNASNELHEDGQIINLDNASILFADGELCLGNCRSEHEVIKFFTSNWPRYAQDQINRAKKMISEYDVESGNSENFEANIGFLGNHGSFVQSVTKDVLPGNKQIAFKYIALGPELIAAEDAEPAPESYEFTVRTSVDVNNTLRQNVANMNALAGLFKSESNVLNEMSTLSEALMSLENRRGETVWKSAREGLDDISRAMLELITKLKPNYDPIVRHLAAVGNARNAVCRRELDALGQ